MISGIFVGLSTIDLVYAIDEFPAPDTKITARTQNLFVGGPATNAAVTFRHLGGHATLVSGVGRHSLASVIRDEAHRFRIPLLDLIPAFDELPPISSVWVNSAGERNVVSPNAAHISLSSPQFDAELCSRASIVLVDGHFMQSAQVWAAAAHARNIPVVLDGGSWKPGTDDLLPAIDIAICSGEFMPPGCSSHSEVIRCLRSRGVSRVAISRGHEPILLASDDHEGEIPVPQVPLLDTTGAGDILHGAFCWFTAAGLPFRPALERAAAIASHSCRYRGTREWMQHLPSSP